MGLIRKTASIATLGIIPFRSRKELLRRAERAHRAAVTELEHEKELREKADRRVSDAERRREAAELQALAAAERSARAKAKAKKAKRRQRHETADQVRAEATKLGRRARSEARRAGKTATTKAREVRAAAEPQIEKGIDRARELGHDAVEATGSLVTEVREKARRGGGRRRHRR